MEQNKQKFLRGDLVHIAKEMPSWMSHFEADMDAIVLGSYSDLCGGESNTHSYQLLLIKDGRWYNEVAWYEEYQLTFIDRKSEEYIHELKENHRIYTENISKIEYIVNNWKALKLSVPGCISTKLMALVGITEPFGNRGEYWDYYEHWRIVFLLLDPILSIGDLDNFNRFIESLEKVDRCLLSNNFWNEDKSIKKPIPESWIDIIKNNHGK